VKACFSTAAFFVVFSTFIASTPPRSAANAGATCFITFWYDSSSAVNGGGNASQGRQISR